jgi:hypothetical protein
MKGTSEPVSQALFVMQEKIHRLETQLETQPKKEWVGLTDEERNEILGTYKPSWERHIAKLIEAKLKEKNT